MVKPKVFEVDFPMNQGPKLTAEAPRGTQVTLPVTIVACLCFLLGPETSERLRLDLLGLMVSELDEAVCNCAKLMDERVGGWMNILTPKGTSFGMWDLGCEQLALWGLLRLLTHSWWFLMFSFQAYLGMIISMMIFGMGDNHQPAIL